MDILEYSIATEDNRKEIRAFLMKHFLKEETMNVNNMDILEYSIATEDNRKEIRAFLMKHFLKEETMNVATAITEEEFAPFADKVLDLALPTPFTVLCRNGFGNLVGVAVSTIYRRDDPEFVDPLGSPQRQEIAAIGAICEDIHHSIWQLLPEVTTVLELDLLSVATKYQRRGIAGKMLDIRKSPESLKGFVCQASSYANQMLLKKRGHQELKDLPFSHFVDKDNELKDVPFSHFVDKDNVQLIKPQDETRSVKLFWKAYDPQ
ncbi:unnamed protein product [Strongylus vulgaris]|uniref:N-acetyltransferase domain-containing protein n=1 Tax=Strongylus vulgaris TaxID=40348 RepID=A0A3P7J803_STRVU|nr:unnamed protein product [Strongylus vulgaris]